MLFVFLLHQKWSRFDLVYFACILFKSLSPHSRYLLSRCNCSCPLCLLKKKTVARSCSRDLRNRLRNVLQNELKVSKSFVRSWYSDIGCGVLSRVSPKTMQLSSILSFNLHAIFIKARNTTDTCDVISIFFTGSSFYSCSEVCWRLAKTATYTMDTEHGFTRLASVLVWLPGVVLISRISLNGEGVFYKEYKATLGAL